MTDPQFQAPAEPPEPQGPVPADGVGNWRWMRPEQDIAKKGTPPAQAPALLQPVEQPAEPVGDTAPYVVESGGATTNVHGGVKVLAASVGVVQIVDERKRDVLEGSDLDRSAFLEQPFVEDERWADLRNEAFDLTTGRLVQPVLIIVAPRSFGSTTFALRLLAEHTDSHARLMKLDADWGKPSRGQLPLEKDHAYQLDLKDPENDDPSADFLDSLSRHSDDLRDRRSCLVLNVAQELWADRRLSARRGVQVIYLRTAPDPLQVAEAHLSAEGYAVLSQELQSSTRAQACLRGLPAVAAVRAAHTIVTAWREQQAWERSAAHTSATKASTLEDRVVAALTDWRSELDNLFGETTLMYRPSEVSLTLEDRCLLLALAVRQSAPLPDVGLNAQQLQKLLQPAAEESSGTEGPTPAQVVFAGRGLRRRVLNVGADVDSQDRVVFDRPAYGRAVLEYVWDNYDAMRQPLLTWLVNTANGSDCKDLVVAALANLTTRHGTTEHLSVLGDLACKNNAGVLAAVMESALRNEHVSRLAWATLYRWAEKAEYAQTVVAVCQRTLQDEGATASTVRMAMVRLRRIAHTTQDSATRQLVLDVYQELALRPIGAGRLVAEVSTWQQGKGSPHGSSLAFVALMTIFSDGLPWLMSTPVPGLDVPRALHDLLQDPETAAEVIPRLASWVRACTGDPQAYSHLRDGLLVPLRGHKMFRACIALTRELDGLSTTEGVNVADDFYDHLFDPRVRPVFPLKATTA